MAKLGAEDQQEENAVSITKMKTIIKSLFRHPAAYDSYHQLTRPDQVMIFRLTTGHNRLRHHLHRKMRLVPSPMCFCGEASQNTEHILQDCRNFQTLREATWPQPVPLPQKLYGPVEEGKTPEDHQIHLKHLPPNVITATEKKKNGSLQVSIESASLVGPVVGSIFGASGLIAVSVFAAAFVIRGLRNCRPARGPVLTVRHRQARLQWAQGHLNWNNVRWQNVLFSDECRFCIDHADGRVRVWRRRGDRYADKCVVENNAWGGPSLMLWGAIGHNKVLGPVIFQGLGPGRGNGITAQRYMDQVLHPHVLPPHVLPFLQAHGNWVFQHDNARPHTARATQDLLQRSGIQVMPWPALSPDMNPIEQFWDLLQTQLNRVVPRPTTVAELDRAVRQAWANIPRAARNTLVRLMTRRCQAVIDATGGHTRY
nr:hypothetical protein BaRGS_000830 [Batillaria attramentaria]